MIKRILHRDILQSLQHFPAVGLVGARPVGKTTLAQMIAQQWSQKTLDLGLERPTDYSTLSEPELFLTRHTDKLVIIDEIQLRGGICFLFSAA